MNYEFPKIKHINDVLPAIEHHEEFIVAKKEGYTVIQYAVRKDDTFILQNNNDEYGKIRRECRGLIFDENGNLISRPFHKFFNLNEIEETQIKNIDFSKNHVIQEKCDGSMIRPFFVNDQMRLGTKMGITDVSIQAEKWLESKIEIKNWIIEQLNDNKTPIFEWVSPNNQIVVFYETSDLILLDIRDNYTGKYFGIDPNFPGTAVKQFGEINNNINEYIEKVSNETEREGDVICFSNGDKLKIKNHWYVRIHKIKEKITNDRHIVDLMLNSELDDIIPELPMCDVTRIRNFEHRFWRSYNSKYAYLESVINTIRNKYQDNRKEIALNFDKECADESIKKFMFGMLSNKALNDMLLQHVQKNIGSNTKFSELMNWLET